MTMPLRAKRLRKTSSSDIRDRVFSGGARRLAIADSRHLLDVTTEIQHCARNCRSSEPPPRAFRPRGSLLDQVQLMRAHAQYPGDRFGASLLREDSVRAWFVIALILKLS